MNGLTLARLAARTNWLLAASCILLIAVATPDTSDGDESKSAATQSDAVQLSTIHPTYEQHVRPILKTHCFHCHGESGEQEGGLDVRLRRLITAGGDSGPAVVPGAPSESLLLERIRAGEMPPEEIDHRPSEEEIRQLELWIQAGAATARPEPEDVDPDRYFTEEERSFWSFQPIQRPNLPSVRAADRVRSPIDQFILAKLEREQLTLSPDAAKRSLLRRTHFGLLGLSPSTKELAAFLADDSPDALERLVDRLLASPHYGERWGRHWLDVAGYADSEGYTDDDPVRTDAYKYRDYVIRALNDDKRVDRFILEQLAGDELVGDELVGDELVGPSRQVDSRKITAERIEQLTATGFLRMAPDGTASRDVDPGQARNDVVAKTLEIVSTSLLGLTVACAQCHDHRYDPIPQRDYYAFRAIFDPALNCSDWKTPAQRRLSLYTDADREKAARIERQAKQLDVARTKRQQELIEATFERELAKLPESLRAPVRAARDTPASKRTPKQAKLLKEHPSVNVTAGSLYLFDRKASDELKRMAADAAKLRVTRPKEEFLRVLQEAPGKQPPNSHVLHRGDHQQPGQKVDPAELTILTSSSTNATYPEIPINDTDRRTTGRRLAYAQWLTSGEHPLVTRVLVNRVWMNHFGRGLVVTPGDFGALGVPPTHPELLDWLATRFVRDGWSWKHLHRMIMTSTIYRQSSANRDDCVEVDADNALHWRMPPRRLEAEVLRDSILSISGQLNRKPFGPAVPVMADQVGQFVIGVENLNAGRPGKVIPMRGEELRRSVYIQARRSRPLSVLDPFDLPAMTPNCISRKSSTVAPQSLLLMNSQFVIDRTDEFAQRVVMEAGAGLSEQIRYAWFAVFARQPSDREVADAESFVDQQAAYFAKTWSGDKDSEKEAGEKANDQPAASRLAALASFCQALLSSNEFLYVD